MRFEYCTFAALIVGAVIFARIAWVVFFGVSFRALISAGLVHPPRTMPVPTVQSGIVVSCCGMRGIVTLAAAFALPESFPSRDIILFAAFAVVLGTLVVQGLTLRR